MSFSGLESRHLVRLSAALPPPRQRFLYMWKGEKDSGVDPKILLKHSKPTMAPGTPPAGPPLGPRILLAPAPGPRTPLVVRSGRVGKIPGRSPRFFAH